MNGEALLAKLRTMQSDARVRATAPIHYEQSGVEIERGSHGTIKSVVGNGALVAVLWDGMNEAVWTAFEGIEVLPS